MRNGPVQRGTLQFGIVASGLEINSPCPRGGKEHHRAFRTELDRKGKALEMQGRPIRVVNTVLEIIQTKVRQAD